MMKSWRNKHGTLEYISVVILHLRIVLISTFTYLSYVISLHLKTGNMSSGNQLVLASQAALTQSTDHFPLYAIP